MSLQDFTIRMVGALILGLLVGFERHRHQHPSALRTNGLVAVGAALFASLSELIVQSHSDVFRIAAAICSGIGFLGAGFIWKGASGVAGLTTAATVWCSGAVGTLAGAGFLFQAGIGTGLVIFTNTVFRTNSRGTKDE